jgi:tetratricopeptide (TPR) repeat protein
MVFKYNPLSFGAIFPFFIIGAIAGWYRYRSSRIILIVIVAYVFGIALFFVAGRFRLPLMPCYIILAVYGATVCYQQIQKGARRVAGVIIILVTLGVGSFFPVYSMPSTPDVIGSLAVGRYYYDRGNYSKALEYYRFALQNNPGFPEIRLNIGACYFRQMVSDSALYYFEAEQRLFPDRADAYANLASYHLVNGENELARRESGSALDIEPYHQIANAVLVRAVMNDSTIGADSICSIADSAARATKHDLSILNEAAYHLIRQGNLQQAESLLVKATLSRPPPIETDDEMFSGLFQQTHAVRTDEKARAFYLMASLMGLKGAYGRAVDYSHKALAVNPDLTDAYVNLILGHAALGQEQIADSVLQDALLRFPHNSTLLQLRRWL